MKTKKKTSKAEGCSKHTLSSIKKLGIELLSSTTHINNLPVLISIINDPSSPPHFVLESLLSLQSFFTPLLPKIPSSSSSSKKSPARDSDANVIYFTWLRSKFDQLAQSLIDLSVSDTCQLDLRVILLLPFAACHFIHMCVYFICFLFFFPSRKWFSIPSWSLLKLGMEETFILLYITNFSVLWYVSSLFL